jgi:2,3-bisphosphoglycerate-dependent phosphoglycerate mutase
MQLILVRHCESDWNAEGLLQGWQDRPLNDTGRQQAEVLAGELSGLGISLILSSDLQRSAQTAAIIGERLNLPLVIDKRLRECGMGEIEGKTADQAMELFRVTREQVSNRDGRHYDFRSIGGEDFDGVVKRQIAALDDLALRYPQDTLLIVGHGSALNCLLQHLNHPTGFDRGEHREVEYL